MTIRKTGFAMIRHGSFPLNRQTAFWFSLAVGAMLAYQPATAQETSPEGPAKNDSTTETNLPDKHGWISLFDGESLKQWQVLAEFDFAAHGKVRVAEKAIVLEQGFPATGIKWKGKFPTTDYQVSLEARRTYGSDFFCGLTFPVGEKTLTLVCGGWGGQVTGLSCIDGESAIENDTCTFHEYQENKWYRIRLLVRKEED